MLLVSRVCHGGCEWSFVAGDSDGRWRWWRRGSSGWRRQWQVAEVTVVGVGDGGGWKKALFVC